MKNQLNPLAAALSMGILWAVGLFVCTLVAIQWNYGTSWLELMVGTYPNYDITFVGALWGLLWAFIDGFIGTYILVWLYNFFVRHFAKRS